jgi:hypothetical protein
MVMVAAGGAMAIAGAGVAGLVLVLVVREHSAGGRKPGVEAFVVTTGVVLLFGAFAAMGVRRVVAGLRGHATKRTASGVRFESWVKRNGYLFALVGWGALSVAALIAAGGPASLLLDRRMVADRLAWTMFLGLLLLPVHVAVHEAGHALAGWIVGFRFQSLRIGWLSFVRDDRGWRASWGRPAVPELLGFHSAVPVGTEALGARFAFHAAGGVAATWAAAFACRWAATRPWADGWNPAESWILDAGLRHVARIGWQLGVLLGVMNAAPFRTRAGFASDGRRIIDHLLPASPARRLQRQFHALCAQGRRPRDWNISPQTFLRALESATRERDSLLLAAAAVALDTDDVALASEVLARIAEAPVTEPQMRHELELQAAMVEAFDGRVAAARDRLDRIGQHPMHPEYGALATAVVLAAEGRQGEAAEAFASWERAITSTGMAAVVRVGNDWAIERLRARIDATG